MPSLYPKHKNKIFPVALLLLLFAQGNAQTPVRGGKVDPQSSTVAAADWQTIRKDMGKTWAVLIANSAYTSWTNLKREPYNDINLVENALKNYQFDRIIKKLDIKQEQFQPYLNSLYDDMVRQNVRSVLIYYAGHGEYDWRLDKGYWIPVDARKSRSRVGYLDDATIRKFIELFNKQATHVLLIADCCFSGTMLDFRSNDDAQPTSADILNLKIDVSKRSAYGITSGRKEERVPNTSHFSRALDDLLTRSQAPFLRAVDVAYEVSKKVRQVIKNQQPQYGPLAPTHEFGQFVFIRKPAPKPQLVDRNPPVSPQPSGTQRGTDLPSKAARLGIDFVPVKGGTFEMGDLWGDGDSDEKPVHTVMVSDFRMSKHEITVRQFRAFAKTTNYQTTAEKQGWAYVWEGSEWKKKDGASWKNPGFVQAENHPVVCVSWDDAIAFCEWLSKQEGKIFRLPREAEWEYAARAEGQKIKYPWDNEFDWKKLNFADKNTNFSWSDKNVDDGYARTAPAGSFPGNALGLHDMAGNVWEWCWDLYDGKFYEVCEKQGVVRDPQGPAKAASVRRVVRGGSWLDNGRNCRTANRLRDSPDGTNYYIGFRVVLSAQ